MSKANPFSMFTPSETVHKVKALNNASITVRDLTQAEKAAIDGIMYSEGFGTDGKPQLSIEAIGKANLMKISKVLVEPKMSVKELEALSVEASSAFTEILELISPKVDEGK